MTVTEMIAIIGSNISGWSFIYFMPYSYEHTLDIANNYV